MAQPASFYGYMVPELWDAEISVACTVHMKYNTFVSHSK